MFYISKGCEYIPYLYLNFVIFCYNYNIKENVFLYYFVFCYIIIFKRRIFKVMKNKEYKCPYSLYHFLGIMKWSLVTKQMDEDNREDRFEVMTNPNKIEEVAEEYGINSYTLMKELIRFADEAKQSIEYNLHEISKEEDDEDE